MEMKFLPTDKLTGTKYRDLILKAVLKPPMDKLTPGRFWTFQQDGAPPHKSEVALAGEPFGMSVTGLSSSDRNAVTSIGERAG